jgi:hypothetical protein
MDGGQHEKRLETHLRVRNVMHERPDLVATRRFVPARWMLALVLWLLMAAPGLALECRVPQTAGVPNTIEETPAQRIPGIVHGARGRRPTVPGGKLVNYLITAYCPVLNGLTGLSDGEKQVRMDIFASRVAWAAC